MKLTASQSHQLKPANLFWFCCALVRLRLRRGPEQLKLLMEKK